MASPRLEGAKTDGEVASAGSVNGAGLEAEISRPWSLCHRCLHRHCQFLRHHSFLRDTSDVVATPEADRALLRTSIGKYVLEGSSSVRTGGRAQRRGAAVAVAVAGRTSATQ
jgi:hypothetical protein